MKVTVIIPTYNEKENIVKLVETVFKVARGVKNHSINILIVDDNSPDGTASLVQKLQKQYSKLHMITGKKEGLGKAYLRGMDYAIKTLKAEVMFEMDADLSHEPKKIPEFLAKIDQGYDLVIGSRYIKGGSIPENWGLHRKIFSVLGNLIAKTLLFNFSHHDWTTGYRAIRSPLYLKVRESLGNYKGYTFQVCFLQRAFAENAKVAEVPIHFIDRVLGKSKIPTSEYIFNLLWFLILTDITNPPRVLRFLIVGTLGFTINTIGLELFIKLGMWPSLAGASGAIFAIISNFIFNNLWTFSDRRFKSLSEVPKKFAIFFVSSFGSVLIQAATIEVVTRLFGAEPLQVRIGYVLGVFLGLIYNFTMYNKVIWKAKATK